LKLSAKAEQFTESVIREMTRLALQHNVIDLSRLPVGNPSPELQNFGVAQNISTPDMSA
jgi:hypothetical protein